MGRYNFRIGREISDDIYCQIMTIRCEHYYDDAYDERYWYGGIHGLLSESAIKKAHEKDISSRFLLLFDETKLVAYARYSTSIEWQGDFRASKLHVFICKKELLGMKIELHINEEIVAVKIGNFLLTQVILDCRNAGSPLLISEICVFPCPNLPSLLLHKKEGFRSIQQSLLAVQRNDIMTQFIVLGKYLNDNENKS